jgi:signal peptidase I
LAKTGSTKTKLSQKPKQTRARKATKRSAAKPSKRTKTKALAFRTKLAIFTTFVIIVLLVLCFDMLRAQSSAMSPAIDKGDLILVFNPPFHSLRYEAGDVVALGKNLNTPNILRLVANNGEHVTTSLGEIQINGKRLRARPVVSDAIRSAQNEVQDCFETLPNQRVHRIRCAKQELVSSSVSKTRLAQGEAYLLGDNRAAALDSRKLGPIAQEQLQGKVLFTLRTKSSDSALFGRWLKFFH